MTQLLYSTNTDVSFGKIVTIDMANNLILSQREGEHEHHHEHEAEAKEGEKEGEHEAEAKEGEKEGEHEAREGEEGEEGEEVAEFVPTTDFGAEYIIYFGAGLLSLAVLAVVIIWIRGVSGESE